MRLLRRAALPLALCLATLCHLARADVCGTKSETEHWYGECGASKNGEPPTEGSKCACKSGKMHGKGWFKIQGASIYSGMMKGGKREGLGWLRLANGYDFMGYFENNLRHGYGIFKAPGGSYDGEFAEDKPSGYGVQEDYMRQTYTGTFLAGKRHGSGVFSMFGGFKYAGDYDHGVRLGCGVSSMDGFPGLVSGLLLGHESGGRWTGCNRTLDCPLRQVYCSCWMDGVWINSHEQLPGDDACATKAKMRALTTSAASFDVQRQVRAALAGLVWSATHADFGNYTETQNATAVAAVPEFSEEEIDVQRKQDAEMMSDSIGGIYSMLAFAGILFSLNAVLVGKQRVYLKILFWAGSIFAFEVAFGFQTIWVEGLTLYSEFSTSYERDRMRHAAAAATAAALEAATKGEL